MARITLQGTEFSTCGDIPATGQPAPDFTLTTTALAEYRKADVAARKIVLNIFPSVDTDVCAASVRAFNEKASRMEDVSVLCVSMDLPFALGRFCGAEGLNNVQALSAFRHPEFGKDYGVAITDGPLAGLLARAVVVIDGDSVVYAELVPEITQEPNYAAAVAAL